MIESRATLLVADFAAFFPGKLDDNAIKAWASEFAYAYDDDDELLIKNACRTYALQTERYKVDLAGLQAVIRRELERAHPEAPVAAHGHEPTSAESRLRNRRAAYILYCEQRLAYSRSRVVFTDAEAEARFKSYQTLPLENLEAVATEKGREIADSPTENLGAALFGAPGE